MLLENVVFFYTKIQTPVLKYQSTTEKEYTVDCLVSKAQAKTWNKEFKKQPAKVIENEDFETQFMIPIPEAFAEQDEQYVIKLKRSAQYQDGTPISDKVRPRVFLKKANGKLEDITATQLVGNGSEGTVSYETKENDYGLFAGLKAIRVDSLVPYEANSGFEELGELDDNAGELSSQEATGSSTSNSKDTGATKVAGKTKSAQKPVKEVVEDEQEEEVKPAPKNPVKRGRPAKAAVEGSVVKPAPKAEVEDNDDDSPF